MREWEIPAEATLDEELAIRARFVPRLLAAARCAVSGRRWLTVAQIAEEEQVSPRTVLRWIEQRQLRARRQPGGRLRIHRDWYADMAGEERILAVVDDEGGE